MAAPNFWLSGGDVIWRGYQQWFCKPLADDGTALLAIIRDEFKLAFLAEQDDARTDALSALAEELVTVRESARDWRRCAAAPAPHTKAV